MRFQDFIFLKIFVLLYLLLHIENIFGGSKVCFSVCFEYYLYFIFTCLCNFYELTSYNFYEFIETPFFVNFTATEHTHRARKGKQF